MCSYFRNVVRRMEKINIQEMLMANTHWKNRNRFYGETEVKAWKVDDAF